MTEPPPKDEVKPETPENSQAESGSSAPIFSAIPFKCRMCEYGRAPDIGCSSALRARPERFPVIHRFMKKGLGGWLDLGWDESGKCRFYVSKQNA